jgi:mannose-1-phosphate guanylyltransferase/mannose-6-phosphate isomerase
VYAVILAGGGGTRLWPLSRAARPKPFLPLTAEATLLQVTVERIRPLVPIEDIYVIADQRYTPIVREQLPELPPENVVSEPGGRNTAAAVALAALAIERDDDDVMAILPADHSIADDQGFRDALATAAALAAHGRLVTLGIRPSGPETGYGYVIAGDEPLAIHGRDTWAVERFVEKPSAERAQELLDGGRAHWNAGIFVWQRRAVVDGLQRHAPDIVETVRSSLAEGRPTDRYLETRATSIDYALLEPASRDGVVAVVPADIGWSDVGSWAALLEALVQPGAVVARIEGGAETLDVDSRDVLVHADANRLVVTVGLDGIIVVDTPDVVLVCSAERAQDVKKVVDRLITQGRHERL